MNQTQKPIAAGLALLNLAAAATFAAEDKGLYVKVDVGSSWIQEAELKSFPGVAGKRDLSFDPGGALDIGVGYQFMEWLGAEIETGVIANSIDSISGASEIDDATLIQVPLMLNLVSECTRCGRWRPFIGGGVGMSSTVLDMDEITVGNNRVFGGSDSDVVFAYQGFAGVRYAIDDHWSVGLTYRYLGTQEASWEVRHANEDITLEGLNTHTVMVGFAYRF